MVLSICQFEVRFLGGNGRDFRLSNNCKFLHSPLRIGHGEWRGLRRLTSSARKNVSVTERRWEMKPGIPAEKFASQFQTVVRTTCLSAQDDLKKKGGQGKTDPEVLGKELGAKTETPIRIFVSTGDVMGDIHGANLVKELLRQAEASGRKIEISALGGQRIKAAGATLIGDNTRLSSIGLMEALPLIAPSLSLQHRVRRFLEKTPPDIVVLLDYPGVNIPFSQYVKQKLGCKVVYYIPPNEWLWNTSRTAQIVSMSDFILAVYPGEADYYAGAGGNVILVGHPLTDFVKDISRYEARQKLGVKASDLVIALLPASRSQELKFVWPIIASAAGKLLRRLAEIRGGLQSVHFIVPAVLKDQRAAIEHGCADNGISDRTIIYDGDQHVALAAADVAIAKSGSNNLETAIYKVPQVVVYKIDDLTAWIARKVFNFSVKYISLVNLILNAELVPEFIQEEAIVDDIVKATLNLLPETESQERNKVLQGYEQLIQLLGKSGAVSRAAEEILARL
ncbi:hypothetical protein R1flu_023363 [Riccia fluitans]|uniref:lipid-A-disaccharide synthase n=1 Tax=Riccia fluitans TaxID=41844 RepID=A0ABD1XUT7_9MARC